MLVSCGSAGEKEKSRPDNGTEATDYIYDEEGEINPDGGISTRSERAAANADPNDPLSGIDYADESETSGIGSAEPTFPIWATATNSTTSTSILPVASG